MPDSRVDFSDPSEEDLERLMQACDPAKFGHGGQDVYDESIRKAGKLDTDRFATKLDIKNIRAGDAKKVNLLDAVTYGLLRVGDMVKEMKIRYKAEEVMMEVRAELYKLNVYGVFLYLSTEVKLIFSQERTDFSRATKILQGLQKCLGRSS